MKSLNSEPDRLRRGRHFHDVVQTEWEKTAEGEVKRERGVVKPSGRAGRIDVRVVVGDDLVSVIELKNSDWNGMSETAVRRNVRRHIRQVWEYIESQLNEGRDVSPGVVFPGRPTSPECLESIERMFEEEGIAVVWQDETIEERQARS